MYFTQKGFFNCFYKHSGSVWIKIELEKDKIKIWEFTKSSVSETKFKAFRNWELYYVVVVCGGLCMKDDSDCTDTIAVPAFSGQCLAQFCMAWWEMLCIYAWRSLNPLERVRFSTRWRYFQWELSSIFMFKKIFLESSGLKAFFPYLMLFGLFIDS